MMPAGTACIIDPARMRQVPRVVTPVSGGRAPEGVPVGPQKSDCSSCAGTPSLGGFAMCIDFAERA